MRKPSKRVLIIVIMLIVSFVCLYAGHFLLPSKEEKKAVPRAFNPVTYSHLSFMANGRKQEGNLLEVDISKGTAEVMPVLSFDSIFGYETLSSMSLRSKAYAAVNAGFFYMYGRPGGMVVINGELITNPTGEYPVLMVDQKKARLKELTEKLSLASHSKVYKIDEVNAEEEKGKAVLYNRWYGSNNRAKGKSHTITIVNGKVTRVDEKTGKTEIPLNGMLLTIYKPFTKTSVYSGIKTGDPVKLNYLPSLGKNAQCYECGSWIVKNGKIVIGKYDKWIGITTNNDPRTVAGIDKMGRIVLFTVDGRQPGYSAGLTGKELGRFLLSRGIENAAMLDGGASTEMIVKGKVVNRPSYDGQERPLGGGLVVRVSDNN